MYKPSARLIFQSGRYVATDLGNGQIVVQSVRNKMRGRRVLDGQKWIDAIATALDRDEAEALCRAILSA